MNTFRSTSTLKTLRNDGILALIFLLILGLYTYLILKDTIPLTGLFAVAALFLIHRLLNKQSNKHTPIDLPVIGLAGLLLITLVITSDKALTMPKVYGLILCIMLFYAILKSIKSFNRVLLVIIALLFLSLAVPAAGFLAADWSGSSFALPARILARLGQYVPAISRLSAGGGIHVNTLGGTLTFFIPMLLSLLWEADAIKRTYLQNLARRNLVMVLIKITLVASLILGLTLIVLTQSRGSLLGVIAGVVVLIIWKNPRVFWLVPFLVVILLAAFLVFGNGNPEQFVSLLDTSVEGDTLQVRLNYWKRTVFMIQDFPVTGVGLGTYGKVFDELYTFTPTPGEGQPSFYAHNMYLAVAASMGLPALVLYLTLFSGVAVMVVSTYRRVRSVVRILFMGLSCGILANLVYGLWDNYLLGEKLAVVLWVYLGVITALFVNQHDLHHRHPRATTANNSDQTPKPERRIKIVRGLSFFINLGSWILISLAAIALVNINPYLSLAVAALGGILLGIQLTKRFERNHLTTNAMISGRAVTVYPAI